MSPFKAPMISQQEFWDSIAEASVKIEAEFMSRYDGTILLPEMYDTYDGYIENVGYTPDESYYGETDTIASRVRSPEGLKDICLLY